MTNSEGVTFGPDLERSVSVHECLISFTDLMSGTTPQHAFTMVGAKEIYMG